MTHKIHLLQLARNVNVADTKLNTKEIFFKRTETIILDIKKNVQQTTTCH